MNRFTVLLQHYESRALQGWSVRAESTANAIAVAQHYAGGGAWVPVSIRHG